MLFSIWRKSSVHVFITCAQIIYNWFKVTLWNLSVSINNFLNIKFETIFTYFSTRQFHECFKNRYFPLFYFLKERKWINSNELISRKTWYFKGWKYLTNVCVCGSWIIELNHLNLITLSETIIYLTRNWGYVSFKFINKLLKININLIN